jgi:hypothetical protein
MAQASPTPQAGGQNEQDPWAAFPDAPPPQKDKAPLAITVRPQGPPQPDSTPPQPPDPWAAFPDKPPPKTPSKPKSEPVGTGAAIVTGLAHGASFGTAPALEGLSEVSKPTIQKFEESKGVKPGSVHVAPHVKAAMGAAEMITNWIMGQDDPAVKEAYERGRAAARAREEAAQEQHPHAYLGGILAGTIAAPGFGAMRAAPLGGRIAQGMVQGGVGGAAFGGGEAVGEGKDLPEIGKRALKGGAIGAPLGGAVGGVIGPRVTTGVGARAAATADELGAPLPRGVVSENPAVQATTGKLRQMPFAGEQIGERVARTGEAAGERIGGIAEGMSGGAPERAVAQQAVRPGLQRVIDTNRQHIDDSYDALRAQIKPGSRFTMPNTDRTLDAIMRERQAAGHTNPAEGLEQFRNVAGGATFNGAHRARTDARNAGDVMNPHPGYNAADFNRLTRAMTADLRTIVSAAASNNTPAGRAAALRAFDDAERRFGPLADQNAFIQRLMDASGEGGIAKLLSAAKEKGGNLQLLAQVRQGMRADEFSQIGGLLLHEMGQQPSTGAFSLSKFATEWGKISDGAKRVMFSPEHLRNINDIAEMGMHVKGALRETSTSHSASMLVFLEIAQAAAHLGVGAATGDLGAGAVGAAATAGGSWMLARWLASPAPAASMGAFTRAYRGITLGQPTPGRIATFKLATRNLANTLGVPLENVSQAIASKVGLKAEPGQDEQVKQK